MVKRARKTQPCKGIARASEEEQVGYDQIPLYVLFAFSAYIITWFLQLGGRIHLLGTIRFEFLLATLLIIMALAVPRQKPATRCNLFPYIGWFFFALIVEIPFSYNVEYSWTVFVDRVVKFACMAFFIVVFVRSPKAMRVFIAAVMLAWFKMGQEGIVGQFTGSLVWENQGVMRLHGATPNYQHPNSFSGFGLGILPFVYYLFPIANRWQKLFLLVMVAFSINIILFTGSRTGYVGFVLFVAYVILSSKHKFKVLAAAAILSVAAVPFIPHQYIERFASITGKEAEGQSKLRRLEILQDAIVIFKEHPFGVGVSAFPTIRELRFGRVQDTHNLYMEVATNLGIQGFIIWALLIASVFRNIHRLSKNLQAQLSAMRRLPGADSPLPSPPISQHIENLRLMLAMLHAINAYIVIRLIVGFFGMDLYEIYWWFTMGIVIAIHNMSQVADRITQSHVSRRGVFSESHVAVPLTERLQLIR